MQDLTLSEFLGTLKQRSIEISARDGRLKIAAPAGALGPELRAELARRKPELLAVLEHAEPTSRPVRRSDVERSGEIHQTEAQQGIWFIQHFSPGNVAYNVPEAFMIHGPVELPLLQQAVDGLVARHDVLRSCFYEGDAGLLQGITPDARAEVGLTDLSTIPIEEADRMLRARIREHARQPFDLTRAPLIRFQLFRLPEQRHVIFFNIHHIIADRRSLQIVREELSILYQAALRKEPALLPALPIEYRDYAVWANGRLAAGALGGQLAYWKAQLADAPPFIEMRGTREYPENPTGAGATVPILIPKPVGDMLKEIGGQEGATMFMLLLAAFSALLFRYSGQKDLCIGSPFTHRKQVETEGIIGLFVNMLVFRCRIEPSETYRDLLRHVRTTALEAFENSDLPFQELVRALKPDLRSRRSPLFQIMFGFDSETGPGQNTFIPVDTDPGTAKFDLTLQLREGPDGVSGWLEYSTDLFDADRMEGLAAGFTRLLGEVAQFPDHAVSTIELPLEPKQAEKCAGGESQRAQPDSWSRRLLSSSRRLLGRSKA